MGNLSIELPFLANRAAIVMAGWQKPRMSDKARDSAIMRFARTWQVLTLQQASISKWTVRRKNKFPDFLRDCCKVLGIKKWESSEHRFSYLNARDRQFNRILKEDMVKRRNIKTGVKARKRKERAEAAREREDRDHGLGNHFREYRPSPYRPPRG